MYNLAGMGAPQPARDHRSELQGQGPGDGPFGVRGSCAVRGHPLHRCGISHNFLTDWQDDTGLRRKYRTPGRMMTCGYGFQRTGWTHRIDLRIRRLGVRVPPSAPSSQARCPPGSGLSCRFGSHAGSRGHTSAAEQGPAHRLGCRPLVTFKQVKWRSRISELPECLRSGLSYPQKIAVGSRSISARRSPMLGDGGSWS